MSGWGFEGVVCHNNLHPRGGCPQHPLLCSASLWQHGTRTGQLEGTVVEMKEDWRLHSISARSSGVLSAVILRELAVAATISHGKHRLYGVLPPLP